MKVFKAKQKMSISKFIKMRREKQVFLEENLCKTICVVKQNKNLVKIER